LRAVSPFSFAVLHGGRLDLLAICTSLSLG
jgi:hypothetical protein